MFLVIHHCVQSAHHTEQPLKSLPTICDPHSLLDLASVLKLPES